MEPLNEHKEGLIAPLNKVTAVSKYLAMLLFIALPFIGGYIGYVYAPEKVVTKEVVVEKKIEPTSQEGKSSYNVEIKTYRDSDLGISFDYPASWGEITIDNEPGNCPSGYSADDCNFRTLLVKDVNSAGIFLTAETKGHSDNPIGRGAFWGDPAGNISLTYQAECTNSQGCTLVTNSNDVTFALYEADPPPEEMGYQPERYYVYNPNNQYYGIVLSSHRLNSQSSDNSKLFREIVVESFEFIQ